MHLFAVIVFYCVFAAFYGTRIWIDIKILVLSEFSTEDCSTKDLFLIFPNNQHINHLFLFDEQM